MPQHSLTNKHLASKIVGCLYRGVSNHKWAGFAGPFIQGMGLDLSCERTIDFFHGILSDSLISFEICGKGIMKWRVI